MNELKVQIVGISTTDEEIIKNTSLQELELRGGGILLIFATRKKVIMKY